LQGRLALPHSVAVDDCASVLYVADLEGRAIRRFSTAGTDAGKLTGSWDVTGYGKPYAVTPGPYGCAPPVTWLCRTPSWKANCPCPLLQQAAEYRTTSSLNMSLLVATSVMMQSIRVGRIDA